MKKLLLAILLTIFSNMALAEWTVIGIGTSSSDVFYADVKSKRRIGYKVKMWTLNDMKKSQILTNGATALSQVSLGEYDCINETFKLLALNFYSGNMQTGRLLYDESYANPPLEQIPPNTLIKIAWVEACGQ
jgi:hypothetical protein